MYLKCNEQLQGKKMAVIVIYIKQTSYCGQGGRQQFPALFSGYTLMKQYYYQTNANHVKAGNRVVVIIVYSYQRGLLF